MTIKNQFKCNNLSVQCKGGKIMRTAKTVTVTGKSFEQLEKLKKAESKKRGYAVSYAILIAEMLASNSTPSNKEGE